MPQYTDLVIDDIVIPDYASRGITFQLSPIATGSLRRDVNGTLHDMTLPQFRKYAVEITCNEQATPEFTAVWRGKEVEVTLPAGLGVEDSDEQLSMTAMVSEWDTGLDEWGAAVSWRLLLIQK